MLEPGRQFTATNSTGYRYGFNGKEKSDEIEGSGVDYDYGLRIYDARIGKFLSADPLYREYPWNSAYAYAENDVIRSIDLDGAEKLIYTFTKNNGTWTKTQLELPKAGPLGDGVLVKYNEGKSAKFFYGNVMPDNTSGKLFAMNYEEGKKNKDGDHVAVVLPGESKPTIGYGHVANSPEEMKKYAKGKTIKEDEAQSLLESDLAKTALTFPSFNDVHMDIALSDFSFNTTDEAEKTEVRWNSSNNKSNFFISQIRARVKSVNTGLVKRRIAEQILFTFKKFVAIDYAKTEQKNWQKVYDSYYENGQRKPENTTTTKIPKKK